MTASGRKKYLGIAVLVSIALVILGVGVSQSFNKPKSSKLKLNGTSFTIEQAADDASRTQGLSGRPSIASDHAMVFVFDQSAEQCFWMKDMKFAIDMVWLDSTNQVTAIEHNVSPNTYPQTYCHQGTKVVEFSAGTAERTNLKISEHVDL